MQRVQTWTRQNFVDVLKDVGKGWWRDRWGPRSAAWNAARFPSAPISAPYSDDTAELAAAERAIMAVP